MDAEEIWQVSAEEFEELLCGDSSDEDEEEEQGDDDTLDPQPATPPFTPATNAAIQTTEILEAILGELDGRTLYCSQRVSRNFAAVITKSPKLRKKLWLEPEPSLKSQRSPGEVLVNPLLFEGRVGWEAFWDFGQAESPSTKRPSISGNDINIRLVNFYQLQDIVWRPDVPVSWTDMILFQPNPFGKDGFDVAYSWVPRKGHEFVKDRGRYGRISISPFRESPTALQLLVAVLRVLRTDSWRI